MFEKYKNNYYTGKITASEILEIENISYCKLYAIMKKEGHIAYRKVCDGIKTDDKNLKKMLREKYANISFRCRGGTTDKYGHYYGMEYLSVMEWAEFCNKNIDEATIIWDKYINSGKNLALALSIDRIDNSIGYQPSNMEFVTHGFNSWKRSAIRPIKARPVGIEEWSYFMSCQEGARHFGIREHDFGEILAGKKYRSHKYEVWPTKENIVMSKNNVVNLKEYYSKYCANY